MEYLATILKSSQPVKLQILHEHIPDGDDMADGAGKDKEVEDGVHILRLVQRIEYGSRDITHAFGDDPDKSSRRD